MSIEVLSVRGLRPEYGKVDRDLWLWFCEAKRDCESYHGPRVTKRLVQAKAKLAFEAAGIVNFKASDGWYIRWLKRWRRAAKQNNEPNPTLKTATDDQLPKKRAPRKALKAKTLHPVILQSSTDKTIPRISLEIGPSDFSSTDETGSISFNNPIAVQTNHENVGLNSFSFANDHLCQSESPASGDLPQEFLTQQYNVPSEIGLVQVEERFAPDTSSLLNFDDIAWHDLSELSCFARPLPKFAPSQALESKPESPGCLTKSVPQMIKLNGLKTTVKGKGKLGEFQKPFQTYVCVKNVGNSQDHGAIRQGGKMSHLHLDQMNDVSACGNFAQHDLEDVSVSSDFVNQLNDEHSLELNLNYGGDNLSHQILHRSSNSEPIASSQNFSIGCGMVQPELDNFGSLLPLPPAPLPEVSASAGPRSDCHLSAAEDDFSSEENDYISDAVMLSMQEDDFSILNCDQSPFQGTLSVVDENSQSDKVNNLDDGMSMALGSEENLMNREHVFYSGGVVPSNRALKDTSNSLMPMPVIEQNGISGFHPGQTEVCVPQETCFMPPQTVCNKGQEQVYCFSSLAEGGASKVQDLLQLPSSVSTMPANQLLGSISLVGNQDLFQISPSGECVNEYVSDHIISASCSPVQNTSNVSDMYFLPCALECEANTEVVNHSNLPLNSGAPFGADTAMQLGPLDSQVMSLPQVAVANADSATLLLSSSPPHLHTDQSTRLITLTSPNTYVISNVPVPVVSPNPLEAEVPNASLSSCSSESVLTYGAMNQNQSSTSPLNCESTKENGFAPYDLQLVESVLSEQDDAPKNPFKAPKKPAACLTEKGVNTSKFKISIENVHNQSPYRRSSGDRYFPYFKEKVVEYASKHTAKEAACYFGVNVNTVTIWTRGKNEVDSVSKNNPDYLMLRWLKKSRESGIILTREQIAERATQLLKTPGNWVKDKSRWFHVWASRLRDEEEKKNRLKNNVKEATKLPLDCGDKKALYPDDFKIEVVLYAEQTSKNLAASIFNIARKRVFEWSTALKAQEVKTLAVNPINQLPSDAEKHVLPNCAPGNTGLVPAPPSTASVKLNSKGLGRAVTSVAVDQELWKWFCEQTAKKNKPKSKDIRAKAVELFRAHNYDKIQCSHGWLKKWSLRYGIALRHEGDGDLIAWCLEQFDRNRNIPHRELVNYAQEFLNGTHKSEFKGSAGWLVRFCKRHRNLLSAKPGIDVEIPNTLMQSISEFRSHIQKLIFPSNTPFSKIGCMDELPLNFTSGNSRSRLLLRRSGLENCHATVILSCLANGELLPPAIIFKGDGPTETMTFNDVPLLVFYQKDCSMTTAIMLEWLELLWNKHVTRPSVLIADCYDPHCPEPVQEACKAAQVSLEIMPAGCSLKLQPLDLAVSRLFEAYIYNRWTRHFSDANQLYNCKRTSFSNNADIGGWVAEAYTTLKETRKDAICRSFLVTGLTSSPNGGEDHLIEDPSHIPFSSLFAS